MPRELGPTIAPWIDKLRREHRNTTWTNRGTDIRRLVDTDGARRGTTPEQRTWRGVNPGGKRIRPLVSGDISKRRARQRSRQHTPAQGASRQP